MENVNVMLNGKKTKGLFQINPAFFIILIWLIFADSLIIALNYFLVILLHELGHYFMAKHRGYKLSKFSLSPYGVSLSYYGETLEERDEIYIAFAGPFVNILSAVLVTALWWLFPSTYFLTYNFVEISIIIALSNLLPAYPLDGGRIFVSMTSNLMNRKKAIKITLENTPPELSSDVMSKGIVLCGGGALLKNIDRYISEQTGIPVFISDSPTECVARGVGTALDNIEVLKKAVKTKKG